jgi:hypothetical protein
MIDETIKKYLRQSDIAEHIEFLNTYAPNIKRAVFIWEDNDSVIRTCAIHFDLSYVESFGLIEIGKQVLFDYMNQDDDDEDDTEETV